MYKPLFPLVFCVHLPITFGIKIPRVISCSLSVGFDGGFGLGSKGGVVCLGLTHQRREVWCV